MYVSKADLAELKKQFKAGMTTTFTKGIRKSSDGNETQDDAPFSLSRYVTGMATGRWHNASVEKKAMQDIEKDDSAYGVGSSSLGGALVPQAVYGTIIPRLSESSMFRMLPGVRTIPMNAVELDIRKITESVQISWGSESSTISNDDTLRTGNTKMQLKKCQALLRVSNELIGNPGAAADAILQGAMLAALQEAETKGIAEGLGGNEMQGFYARPDICNTDLSGEVDADDILNLELQISQNNGNVNFFMTSPAVRHRLRKLKDGDGHFVLTELGCGTGNTAQIMDLPRLFGRPLFVSNQFGITNRPSASESWLLGGDARQLLIGDGQLRMDVSKDSRFSNDEVEIRLVRRIGFDTLVPGVFGRIVGITVS